ncbi:unnamed protein product [Gordionus sp. m RMFG-2023]
MARKDTSNHGSNIEIYRKTIGKQVNKNSKELLSQKKKSQLEHLQHKSAQQITLIMGTLLIGVALVYCFFYFYILK